MKNLIVIYYFFTSCFVISQANIDSAQFFFDRYEYALTAELIEKEYEEIKADKLSENRLKKLIYSYYRVGNFEKIIPLADWLVNSKFNEPYFYIVSADAHKALGNLEEAKKYYNLYKQQDGSLDINNKIKAIDHIKDWKEEKLAYLKPIPHNHTKALQNTGINLENALFLKEVGYDKKGNRTSALHSAEYFTMRPFLEADNELLELEIKGIDNFTSVKSISEGKNYFYAAVFNPIAEEKGQEFRIIGLKLDPNKKLFEVVEEINLPKIDSLIINQISVSPNGKKMVFSAINKKNKKADLYLTSKDKKAWGKPVFLDEINTSGNDINPVFSNDSLISFSSDGRIGYGDYDIFLAHFKGNKIKEVSHPKSPINSPKDDFNYVLINDSTFKLTSNRYDENFSDDNVYLGQYFIEKIDEEEDITEEKPDFYDLWTMEYIYFNFDEAVVIDKFEKVDEFVEYVKENPNFTVILTGHTDSRGDDNYNIKLGRKRAEEVKIALSNKGIPLSQILTYSKGSNEPFVDCSSGCSEKEHSKNRVVTVDLLKMPN